VPLKKGQEQIFELHLRHLKAFVIAFTFFIAHLRLFCTFFVLSGEASGDGVLSIVGRDSTTNSPNDFGL
jgi:hypothetical protein